MNKKVLAIAGLIALQNCSATQMTRLEKDVVNDCKDKLDDAIINRYIELGVIKNYKLRKEKHEYDEFITKFEDHPILKKYDLRNTVLCKKNARWHCDIKDNVCRIRNHVLAISRCTFMNAKKITKFILSENLLGIDCMAFAKTNIEEIYIPDSVVGLASYAFYKCENLKFVSVSKNTIVVADAFKECPNVKFYYRG